MPISKQRNKHIQRVLIEAAKLAPRACHELAVIRAKELERETQPGHAEKRDP
jgi:transposase